MYCQFRKRKEKLQRIRLIIFKGVFYLTPIIIYLIYTSVNSKIIIYEYFMYDILFNNYVFHKKKNSNSKAEVLLYF